jgi:hypothetical protein
VLSWTLQKYSFVSQKKRIAIHRHLTRTHSFYRMNEFTHITNGPHVVPAERSGLTALKNVYGHGGGGSGSKDGDSPATNYGHGDDSDTDSEDDSPGNAYGYGGPGGVYGYGGNAKPGGAYGYGDDDDDDKGCDYGYGEDKGAGNPAGDYGYGEDKDASNPAGDYGYGDEAAPPKPILSDAIQPVRARPRLVRRNSCLVHKEDNPLAGAEYLLGGPPRMSDRDMDMDLELNNEGSISA